MEWTRLIVVLLIIRTPSHSRWKHLSYRSSVDGDCSHGRHHLRADATHRYGEAAWSLLNQCGRTEYWHAASYRSVASFHHDPTIAEQAFGWLYRNMCSAEVRVIAPPSRRTRAYWTMGDW